MQPFNSDIDDTVRRLVAEEMNKPVDGAKPSQITVNLGNGQEMTFNNQEELSQNLQAALGQVGTEVAQLKAKVAEYEQQQQFGQRAEEDVSVATPKFDMKKFIAQMQENPVEAFDYVDSFRYGTEKPIESLKKELEETRAIRQEVEVDKFLRAHPEFPGGKAANVLDQVRTQLHQPMTAVGLETAYTMAIQRNMLPDFKTQYLLEMQKQQLAQQWAQQTGQYPPGYQPQQQAQQQEQQQYRPVYSQQPQQQLQNFMPQQPRAQGIPSVPRGGEISQETASQLENLPLDKIEEILRKAGAI